MDAQERRRATQLDQICTLLGPLTLDPVEGVRKLEERRRSDERHMSLCEAGAQVVSFAAAINGDLAFRDNTLKTAFKKLAELEEATASLRRRLEAEQRAMEG